MAFEYDRKFYQFCNRDRVCAENTRVETADTYRDTGQRVSGSQRTASAISVMRAHITLSNVSRLTPSRRGRCSVVRLRAVVRGSALSTVPVAGTPSWCEASFRTTMPWSLSSRIGHCSMLLPNNRPLASRPRRDLAGTSQGPRRDLAGTSQGPRPAHRRARPGAPPLRRMASRLTQGSRAATAGASRAATTGASRALAPSDWLVCVCTDSPRHGHGPRAPRPCSARTPPSRTAESAGLTSVPPRSI